MKACVPSDIAGGVGFGRGWRGGISVPIGRPRSRGSQGRTCPSGAKDGVQSLTHPFFHLPPNDSHHAGRGRNEARVPFRRVRGKLAGEGIRLQISRARAVGEGEVESLEKKHPPSLSLRRYSKFLWSVHTVNGSVAPSSQWRHSCR